MKIGVFGGCFNPPHKRHKKIAQWLILNGYVDKVIYVPTGDEYSKRGLIDHEHRVNMLNLAIGKDENIEVSPIGKDENCQYTYQTLDRMRELYKDAELYFICGEDNLKELDTWKRYEYILENYKLLVMKRNEDDISEIVEKYEPFSQNIIVTEMEADTLSSTMIRNLILKEDKKVLELMDKEVYNYICINKLYKEEN